MKWFSINKYSPPTAVTTILRAIKNDCNWEKYFTGYIEGISDIDCLSSWELYPASYPDLNINEYRVTHFAIIDPVEIEE